MLRITAYADRLENDLDELDWPESIKALQRNWIGRSTGAEVDFFIGRDVGAQRQAEPAGVQSLAQRARRRRLSAQRPATTCCGFSPPGPTRSTAPRTWSSRRSIRWSRG